MMYKFTMQLYYIPYFTTYLGSTENILRLDFIIPRGVGILFKETMHKTILLKLFYYQDCCSIGNTFIVGTLKGRFVTITVVSIIVAAEE